MILTQTSTHILTEKVTMSRDLLLGFPYILRFINSWGVQNPLRYIPLVHPQVTKAWPGQLHRTKGSPGVSWQLTNSDCNVDASNAYDKTRQE